MPGGTSATSSLMRPMPGIRSPSSRVGIVSDQRERTNASWAYASKIFACTTWPVMFENAVTSTPSPASRRHVPPCRGSICRTRLRTEGRFGQLPNAEILGLQVARIEASCKCRTVFSGPLSSYIRFNSRYLIAFTMVFSRKTRDWGLGIRDWSLERGNLIPNP